MIVWSYCIGLVVITTLCCDVCFRYMLGAIINHNFMRNAIRKIAARGGKIMFVSMLSWYGRLILLTHLTLK